MALERTVAVVGLGYVGLPLAVAFGRKVKTIGYDVSKKRVGQIRDGADPTGEVADEQLRGATLLEATSDARELARASHIIVAVPTPIDQAHQPDFRQLIAASETVARHMTRGATVVYESTVYPGATEEICVPVLEQQSGLRWQRDFHVGYSPERINPGDREHTLDRIVKVVSGDTATTLEAVAELYELVVPAGVHRVSSIKVAEAAKVIENTQRDLNIALMNELAVIFGKVGVDTLEVLEAAGTKWNFLPFRPGLVGGHCIGVDPYYLAQKAEMLGHHPEVILAGRRINDRMGKHVAEQTLKQMIQAGWFIKGSKIIVLGLTFKEDVPDLRNSRVMDVIRELQSYGAQIFVHDPVAAPEDARAECGLELVSWPDLPVAQAMIAAVTHKAFLAMTPAQFADKLQPGGCFIDIKSRFNAPALRAAGINVWRL